MKPSLFVMRKKAASALCKSYCKLSNPALICCSHARYTNAWPPLGSLLPKEWAWDYSRDDKSASKSNALSVRPSCTPSESVALSGSWLADCVGVGAAAGDGVQFGISPARTESINSKLRRQTPRVLRIFFLSRQMGTNHSRRRIPLGLAALLRLTQKCHRKERLASHESSR